MIITSKKGFPSTDEFTLYSVDSLIFNSSSLFSLIVSFSLFFLCSWREYCFSILKLKISIRFIDEIKNNINKKINFFLNNLIKTQHLYNKIITFFILDKKIKHIFLSTKK